MLIMLMMLSLQPEGVRPDCSGNTLEMNACVGKQLEAAEARLQKYQQAAIDRYSSNDPPENAATALGITASSNAFAAYRSIECATVYQDYVGGTIRTVMGLSCQVELTDQRTHTIWENWLHYMDSTPPILPEPKPTE